MTLHKNGVRAGQVASGVLPESGGALSWMIMVLNPLAVVRVINASPPPPVQPMAGYQQQGAALGLASGRLGLPLAVQGGMNGGFANAARQRE